MKSSMDIFAENVRLLMLEQNLSYPQLARRTNGEVTDRHLRRVIKEREQGITLDKVDAIAKALGVTPSDLVAPHIEIEAARSPGYRRLIDCWLKSDREGREMIEMVASREANR